MENIKALDAQYIMNTYARFPVQIVAGRGSLAYDDAGREYIDMGTGIGVTAFGYSDSEWVAAVTAQLGAVQHTSNLYFTAPGPRLAQLLCEKTGMRKVFFSNSGAEANECAIKAARKYAAERRGADCYTIITMKNSFHGRTLTTLAATGQDHYHELFQPLTPGFVHAEPDDLEDLERLVRENSVAAIMLECIQGEGGVRPLSADFIRGAAAIAAREDILLIIDEVQTGNGRTGEMYSYMNFGIRPDLVTTAKGIGGGLPLGACIFGEKVENIFAPGDHGSTFGANPAACAGGCSIVERLTPELLQTVREKGERVRALFRGAKGVEDVTGLGLMIGIKPTKPASEVVGRCLERGVKCLTAKDRVRLLPALNIPEEQLMRAAEIIKAVCAE